MTTNIVGADRHGPELVRIVDVAGTSDLDTLQDIVALAHSAGGNIHALFGAGECVFFKRFEPEHEDPPIYPDDKCYFQSPTGVLTKEAVEAAISSKNGYFEYSQFFSFEPGGWAKGRGFTHVIEPPKPIGSKVIQLQLERHFVGTLNLPTATPRILLSSDFGTLSKELAKYCVEKVRSGEWNEITYLNYKSIFDTFVEIVGDKSVAALSREDVTLYTDTIDTLPPNRNKLKTFRDLDAKAASELNARLGGKSISKKTKNNYLKRLCEPFDEFVTGGALKYNYFRLARSYRITKEEEIDAREPWSADNLKKMIESEAAIKLLAKNKHAVSKPWALLICMFTGARIGEILSLPLDGVGWDEDVPYFDIVAREGHNRLKRPASRRKVPVHPTLIDLGFEEYLKRAKHAQADAAKPMLFTDVRFTKKHGWGRATKDWYNNTFFTKLDIKSTKKVTHSFRHNISDFFRRATSINQLKASAYLGHSDNHNRPEWQKGYGSPYSPKELLEVTKHIQYTVNFSELKKQCLDKLRPQCSEVEP